mmetsp:Transcript_132003/g.228783  ORF Transcript_132003/g.228783 Transcript_132003/m.228783 type:complete len:104 (-) Transcript_132003:7-318(-)
MAWGPGLKVAPTHKKRCQGTNALHGVHHYLVPRRTSDATALLQAGTSRAGPERKNTDFWQTKRMGCCQVHGKSKQARRLRHGPHDGAEKSYFIAIAVCSNRCS